MRSKSLRVEDSQALTTLLGLGWFREKMRQGVYSGLQHEAEDIVGDAVCELIRWPPGPGQKATTVALVAVRRRASRYQRQATAEAGAIVHLIEASAVQPDEAYMQEAERAYVGERLAAALATLPDSQAAALRMYANDLPQDEIARHLGVTRGTVASWIKRARAKLKQQLADLIAA